MHSINREFDMTETFANQASNGYSDAHVRESRRPLLLLEPEQRMAICLEGVFLDYPIADSILKSIDYMLKSKNKVQAPCMLIWGEGGYGKTSLIRKIKERNVEQTNKLVFMSMRQTPENYNFRELLLEAFGIPLTKKFSGFNASKEFARTVAHNNIKGIVIDEIHDALTLTPFQQRANLSLLKNLSGEQFNLSVIASGTEKASEALRLDAQLERRYLQWPLAKWELDENFRSFLLAYERTLPLKNQSRIWDEVIARMILKTSSGIMDNVAKIIQVAAAEAIRTGEEQISAEIIEHVHRLAPHYGVSLMKSH